MSHYSKLDLLLLDRINTVNGATFAEIERSHDVSIEAHFLGVALGREPVRIIDGRLQALRQRGSIRFDRPVWRIAERAA